MKITKKELQKLIQEAIKEQRLDGRAELRKKDPFALRAQLEKAVHNLARKIDDDLEISEGLMMDDREVRGKYASLLVELGDALVEFHTKFNDIKARWNEIR